MLGGARQNKAAQVVADFGLHLFKGPRASTPSGQLQITTQTSSQTTHSRDRPSGHQSPTEVRPALWGGPLDS